MDTDKQSRILPPPPQATPKDFGPHPVKKKVWSITSGDDWNIWFHFVIVFSREMASRSLKLMCPNYLEHKFRASSKRILKEGVLEPQNPNFKGNEIPILNVVESRYWEEKKSPLWSLEKILPPLPQATPKDFGPLPVKVIAP